jgi:hypothetical protein
VLVAAVGFFWSLASPPTSSPDERDHAVNATAVARGQFVGDEPNEVERGDITDPRQNPTAFRTVEVPEIYRNPSIQCFAFDGSVTAACLQFDGSDRIAPMLTPVSWYPPAYYLAVGLVSRPFPAGPAAMYIMRFAGVAIMAALIASAVASLQREPSAGVRIVALLVALTPMAFYLGASVNPNGVEVAAGLALWASGAVLVRELRDGTAVDGRLVTRVGIAAAVLTLSRHDAPFWLGVIVVTLALVSGRDARRAFLASRVARIWSVVVVVATVAQLAWVQIVGTFSEEHSLFLPEKLGTSVAWRSALGRTSRWFHEMVGFFGWLDTPSPTLTVFLWIFALGGLLLLAVSFGRTRWVVATLAVLALVVAIPVLLEFGALREVIAGRWQGRYTLPLAVGVPFLAAMALERDEVLPRISSGAFPIVVAVLLAVAHIVAFGQNIRRYAVGYDGKVLFFLDPVWSPPLGGLTVLAGFSVSLVLLFAWLVGGRGESHGTNVTNNEDAVASA